MDIDKNLHILTFDIADDVINYFAFKPHNFRRTQVTDEERLSMINEINSNLNVKIDKIIRPYQQHTSNIKIVDENTSNDDLDAVDGVITNKKGVGLTIVTADCQAIYLYDEVKKVIGCIHSGWSGTYQRIISNAIQMMIDNFNSNPKDIKAFIAPSILKCCFEVDEDLKEKFEAEFKDIDIQSCIEKGEIKDNKQKYFIDTVSINKQVLMNLGLLEENIVSSNICSKCNNDFIHSHRADGSESGRNMALICMV